MMRSLYHSFWIWWHRGEMWASMHNMSMRKANYHFLKILYHEQEINNKKES